tara:strand:+ start:88 stop:399 length:312 start_codon:yes stop_codon:yes gene_type:complete
VQLEVIPEVFSPNNDGHQDFANITIEIERPAKTSIHVYDKTGFIVSEICESELINQNAHWVWNGLDQNNLKLPVGLYMIVIELTKAEGKQEILRHPIVLSNHY